MFAPFDVSGFVSTDSARSHSQASSRFPQRVWAAAFLGVAMVILLSGCARIQVWTGARIELKKVPVTSMQASLPKGLRIAPGQKSPLVATFVDPNGKVFVTAGEGHGKVLWKDLTVTATVAKVNNKGVVSLSRDPRISDGKTPHVVITAPSHPGLQAELDIPVRYDWDFKASYHGSDGSNGFDGTNGTDGSTGTPGSMDPDHPSKGGDGGDGTNGGDGSNGSDGSDGPSVRVLVAVRTGSQPLLQVSVMAEGKDSLFLVDPQGGSLSVSSTGGSGGSGGRGGRGGRGGSGGMGSPDGSSGRDGRDGSNGTSGSGGRGGSITVVYDPKVRTYLQVIRLSNPRGPTPVFREESVGALW